MFCNARSNPWRVVSVLAGCMLAGPVVPAGAQTVSGRVVSLVDRAPIPAAVVSLEATAGQVLTDSLGRFSFEAVATGPHELTVRHPACHAMSRSLEVLRPGRGTPGRGVVPGPDATP